MNPSGSKDRDMDVAILIPCYNEEKTVGRVVRDFRAALPGAAIYVYDNNSSDATAREAAEAGATVRHESRQGKGNVIRRMLSEIEADVFLLVDGDDTYNAEQAGEMIDLLVGDRLAMVVGRRVHASSEAYRRGHLFGNELLTRSVAWIFGKRFHDMLSGYRALSRRFAKSFPGTSRGFEIETELTVHALSLELPAREMDTAYKQRPEGSASKLRTYRDGLRLIWKIVTLFKNERPLAFFSAAGAALFALAIVLAWPVVMTFIETGLVPRFPTAILATGLTLAGIISLVCGLVLDVVTRGRRELKLLAYLQAADRSATTPPPEL